MKALKVPFAAAVFATLFFQVVHAEEITGDDLQNCEVLLGHAKVDQYAEVMKDIKHSADAGKEDDALMYGEILSNRFVCYEEQILGEQPWSITSSAQGGKSQTTLRPTIRDLKDHADAYSAFAEMVAAFKKIESTNLSARMMLGYYFANYDGVMTNSKEGYFYSASVFEAICRPQHLYLKNAGKCRLLYQYKSQFLGRITPQEQVALDEDARAWVSAQFPATARFQTGMAAYRSNNFADAVTAFNEAAQAGNEDAQLFLGEMYSKGQGEAKDNVLAVYWFRKAAEKGEAMAQNKLGFMYNNGLGVEKDHAMAVKWYRQAVEQGQIDALFNLGQAYAYGEGVEKNEAQGIQWYRKAAEQGFADAQFNLGVMYSHGQGAEKDAAQAVKWYRKAAEQGHTYAQYNLGIQYYVGEGVEKDDAQAAHWFRKAAEQGHATAQSNLASLYEDGAGVVQDFALAADWYKRSARQGMDDGQRGLGLLYRDGRGVAKNPVVAYSWLSLAAQDGNQKAGKESEAIAESLTADQLQQAQKLAAEWKKDSLISEVAYTDMHSSKKEIVRAGAMPASDNYPPLPEKRSGMVSYNTRCTNDYCYRTYDSGRKVYFSTKRSCSLPSRAKQ